MKIRTVKILSCLALSLACVVADAQKREIPEGYLPQAGDVSFGLTINPLTATRAVRIAAGEATGDKIVRVSDVAYQMQFMTQDPLAALSVKYKMNDKLSFRGMLGFSGVQVNYKEYVLDDRAVALNPLSKAQVVDQITCRLNLGNVQAGVEYSLGERKLRFIMGANIVYAFG